MLMSDMVEADGVLLSGQVAVSRVGPITITNNRSISRNISMAPIRGRLASRPTQPRHCIHRKQISRQIFLVDLSH